MEYLVRPILSSEYPLLDEFLYEAIFVPKGAQDPPRSIIAQPDLQVYVKGFGMQANDHCLVAEADGKVVGAVWVRQMNDYGHWDDVTPSLAIALYPAYRGKGIGSVLMKKMLELLQKKGFRQVSLSVQKENACAVRLYRKSGFEVVRDTPDEYLMICSLSE